MSKDKWVRRFSVDETSKHNNGFTIYKIMSILFPIESPEAVTAISVWKRYSDIQRLHKSMKSLHAGLHLRGTFPALPRYSYFRRFQPDVITDRARTIKTLLEFIAEHRLLFTSTDFVNFLQTGYPEPCAEPGVINSIRSSLHLPIEETPPLEYPTDDDEARTPNGSINPTASQQVSRDETDFISQIPIYEAADVEVADLSEASKRTGSLDSLDSLESIDSDLFDELAKLTIDKPASSVKRNVLPDLINFDEPSTSKIDDCHTTRTGNTDSDSLSLNAQTFDSALSPSHAGRGTRTEDSYIFEAGYMLNLAARCEDAGDYAGALDHYKAGIEKLLVGARLSALHALFYWRGLVHGGRYSGACCSGRGRRAAGAGPAAHARLPGARRATVQRAHTARRGWSGARRGGARRGGAGRRGAERVACGAVRVRAAGRGAAAAAAGAARQHRHVLRHEGAGQGAEQRAGGGVAAPRAARAGALHGAAARAHRDGGLAVPGADVRAGRAPVRVRAPVRRRARRQAAPARPALRARRPRRAGGRRARPAAQLQGAAADRGPGAGRRRADNYPGRAHHGRWHRVGAAHAVPGRGAAGRGAALGRGAGDRAGESARGRRGVRRPGPRQRAAGRARAGAAHVLRVSRRGGAGRGGAGRGVAGRRAARTGRAARGAGVPRLAGARAGRRLLEPGRAALPAHLWIPSFCSPQDCVHIAHYITAARGTDSGRGIVIDSTADVRAGGAAGRGRRARAAPAPVLPRRGLAPRARQLAQARLSRHRTAGSTSSQPTRCSNVNAPPTLRYNF
uniref:PX domain-containing protein n=1 Tax=Bombyx mori TaxID=7091 RepID=A0A8R2R5H4_BOMMO|nr:spidroin-1 isoform X2 [Bombyx mori]